MTAPSTNHSRLLRPSSVSLTRASSPGGEAPAPRSPLDKIEQMCYTMVEKIVTQKETAAGTGIAVTGSYGKIDSLRDAPPDGELPNLPLRGRGTAAAVDEGSCGRELLVCCVFPTAPAQNAPPQSGLRPASTTFCGIAATGSYVRFNSLRDAPPGGEAFFPNLPPRGRGTAAAVDEGSCGREWLEICAF